jgi:DNA-binding CsgD family transcriptional regulator
MEGLRLEEVRAVVDLAHEAAWVARTEPRRFPEWSLSAVATLVPSDSVWQLEFEAGSSLTPAARLRHVTADDRRIRDLRNCGEGREAWARLIGEHPLRRERVGRPLDFRTLRNSDFSTQKQFRRLETYDIFFRPFGLHYVATVGYRGPRGAVHLVCARRRVDFTTHDLMLLDLVGAVLGPAVSDPAPPSPRPPAELGLTTREAEVVERVARGRSNSEIGADLGIAAGTVKKHLDNVFAKFGVRNRIQATRVWLDATGD